MIKKSHYQAWLYLAETWKKLVMPPSRPCKTQLKIWDKIIKEKARKSKEPRALILGATPELRDLCLKNNFKTTVCDINPTMVKGMTSLMKHKNDPREEIIIGDCLKVNFLNNSFDIVMEDASLNQILNVKDVTRLVGKIYYTLKPDGLFLAREIVRISLEPVIKGDGWIKWFKKYKKDKMTNADLYSFYKYQSDANLYPESPSIADIPLMFKKVDELSQQEEGLKDFINWLDKVLGRKSKPALIFLKKDLEKLLEKYFKLLPIKQCHDNKHCKYMPLILAKPKKI